MANILVLGAKVPFTSGGQEILVATLMRELKSRGHKVDMVDLPYQALPKEDLLRQAAYWRSIDFSRFGETDVDLIIATKFPTYYARHPRKSLWLVHQHRPAYDLYAGRYSDISDDPRDEQFRRLIVQGDNKVISECQYISGISQNVITRLEHYNKIKGDVLYPPLPMGDQYRCGEYQDYILSVGRLCSIKRVDLMLKAMPIVHGHVKLKVVGSPDEPGIMEYFQNEIAKHSLQSRVEFLGRVSEEDLIDLFANALGIFYAPHNEDYGYVTLEGFASGKPILTANDSGGVLEFVQDGQNGFILEPSTDAFGHAANRLVQDKELAQRMGMNGFDFIQREFKNAGWDHIITSLLSPLQDAAARKEVVHG